MSDNINTFSKVPDAYPKLMKAVKGRRVNKMAPASLSNSPKSTQGMPPGYNDMGLCCDDPSANSHTE